MTANPLVLCVGEPMIVLCPPGGEPLERTARLHVSIGGAETNVAVHLARLGVPVRLAGRVGADPFGRRIRTALAAEGVDVSALDVDPARPTGLYAKDPAAAGTTAYYFRRGSATSALDHLAAGALDGVNHIHATGILAALGPGCAALVDELLDSTIDVSFDVNHRPSLWDDAEAGVALRELARRATIVFVGLDEAHRLWGAPDADAVRALLPNVELVVKNAEHPAVAFRGEQRVQVAALEVTVVEPVGAGDAFAAGYLAGRLATAGSGRCPEDTTGADLARALRTGHAVAAGALSTHGDQGDGVDPHLLYAATTGEGWPDG